MTCAYVDWKVWAKQDRYYVKQFEEDTNLRCTLLVDVSGSMRYGKGAMNKYEYACSIAASLALLATQATRRRGLRGLRRRRAHDRAAEDQAEPPGLDPPGHGNLLAAEQNQP